MTFSKIEAKSLAIAALIFAGGIGAAQFFQPALAQSGASGDIIVSGGDGTVWLWDGASLFHCKHVPNDYGSPNDACHYVKK